MQWWNLTMASIDLKLDDDLSFDNSPTRSTQCGSLPVPSDPCERFIVTLYATKAW